MNNSTIKSIWPLLLLLSGESDENIAVVRNWQYEYKHVLANKFWLSTEQGDRKKDITSTNYASSSSYP